jgi:hypothetical protein
MVFQMIDSNNRKIAFVNIPLLIDHYKTTKLRESCLVRPVERLAIYKVIGVHKFDGDRTTDLPFERGEIFEILDKPEESWWRARNSLGCTGLIPSNYVKIVGF